MSMIRHLLKRALPDSLARPYEAARNARTFAGRTSSEIFESVYARGMWGRDSDGARPFFSGLGSHDPVVVEPYVRAVTDWLSSFEHKPRTVDLGCGDFNVGARIRPYCGRYIACDVVDPLIRHNRERYASLGVTFRRLDAARDPLPPAEVYFVRQVFQHLSNAEISSALARIRTACRLLVVTEHLPPGTDFVANRDKPSGPGIRTDFSSGVVLTEPPFSLAVDEATPLCEVQAYAGRIVTIAYRLPAA